MWGPAQSSQIVPLKAIPAATQVSLIHYIYIEIMVLESRHPLIRNIITVQIWLGYKPFTSLISLNYHSFIGCEWNISQIPLIYKEVADFLVRCFLQAERLFFTGEILCITAFVKTKCRYPFPCKCQMIRTQTFDIVVLIPASIHFLGVRWTVKKQHYCRFVVIFLYNGVF